MKVFEAGVVGMIWSLLKADVDPGLCDLAIVPGLTWSQVSLFLSPIMPCTTH